MPKFEFEVQTLDPEFFDEIAKLTGRSGRGIVVRDALTLYKYLMKRRETGEKLFIGTDSESAEEVDPTNPPVRAGIKVRRR